MERHSSGSSSSSDGHGQQRQLSSSAIETVAGFTAGVAATLVVHPFDILKTRLQLQTGSSYAGQSFSILRSIVRDEGGRRVQGNGNGNSSKYNVLARLAPLYRGLAPNMVGNSVSWALYFLWYGNMKSLLARRHERLGTAGDNKNTTGSNSQQYQQQNLTPLDYFVASGVAGLSTSALTNPIWVIKTRMLASGRDAPGAYRGMFHGAVSIWRNEGVRGFWHGLVPSLFSISHGAVQFAVYEELKIRRANSRRYSSNTDAGGSKSTNENEHITRQLSNWDYLVLSGFSKAFASGVTYPFQVIRARLQTYRSQNTYHGFSDAVRQIWTHEGARGFYRGLVPNIVRVLPSTCVTFLVYENTKYYLPRLYDDSAQVR